MQDDFGDQEAEYSEGRDNDQMVEIEEGRLLRGFQGGDKTGLGGSEELPDDWTTTAKVARNTARNVLGVSSKQKKEDKENWWWDEEVQESIRKKILAKKRCHMQRDEESTYTQE